MHYCAMCPRQFTSKSELNEHTRNHAENDAQKLRCPMCPFDFADSLSLENHQNVSGHHEPRFSCDNCNQRFVTKRSLDQHLKPPFGCTSAASRAAPSQQARQAATQASGPVTCDRCSNTFTNQKEYNKHRSFQNNGPCADHNHKAKSPSQIRGGYQGPDKPSAAVGMVLGYATSSDGSEAPTNMSDNAIWCGECKKSYASQAQHNLHALWCTTKHDSVADAPPKASKVLQGEPKPAPKAQRKPASSRASSIRTPRVEQRQAPLSTPKPTMAAQPTPLARASTTTTAGQDSPMHHCSHPGCARSFRSEAALKVHMGDVHGIGGQPLDLMGRDSWMLNQRTREANRAQGLLHPPSGRGVSPRGRGTANRGRGSFRGRGHTPSSVSMGPSHPVPAPIPAFGTPPSARAPMRHTAPQLPLVYAPVQMPVPMTPSFSDNTGDALEKEQAKEIQGKILRLLVQNDIFIHHDGKFEVGDLKFTRIPTEKQSELAVTLDGMCHLPKILQGEYLPPPKAFLSEYKAQYPSIEFESSPSRNPGKPGLGVVALVCSKVVLANGLEEVVKVAAVDVVTCRIVMNHLVCTDPRAKVANWNTRETGILDWKDMEEARSQGYKVVKGWSAARAALWKFVDKDTIVVGHNLRSDLDCLRMVHGRAVDIAKVAEKAAKGPLSTQQLGLYSLCRDFPKIMLKIDGDYGCDVLQEAFAAREMALWAIKHKDAFESQLRQNSLSYQMIRPIAAAA